MLSDKVKSIQKSIPKEQVHSQILLGPSLAVNFKKYNKEQS